MVWLATCAFAREVVDRGPEVRPPEAWFVLDGTTWCDVLVVVGPDGIPRDARPRTCPDVLRDAIVAGAMRWRWARGAETTGERIEVPVGPPAFRPRPRVDGSCLAAFVVTDGEPQALHAPLGRCEVDADAVLPVATEADRRRPAWCEVRVRAEEGAPRVEVGECADGYAEVAAAAVSSWAFAPSGGPWRVLVGYAPSP